jgi:hypothetical protein
MITQATDGDETALRTLPEVPQDVRAALARALEDLRVLSERLEAGRNTDAELNGRGRYEAEAAFALAVRFESQIQKARGLLRRFRQYAPDGGVDPEVYLASMGGEPDTRLTLAGLEFLGRLAGGHWHRVLNLFPRGVRSHGA